MSHRVRERRTGQHKPMGVEKNQRRLKMDYEKIEKDLKRMKDISSKMPERQQHLCFEFLLGLYLIEYKQKMSKDAKDDS